MSLKEKKEPKKKKQKEINIHSKILECESKNDSYIDAVQKLTKKEFEERCKQREFEDACYKKFVKANKGKKYIDINHINDLGLSYDVLFVVSEKNVGKTTNIIYKLFKHYYQNQQKIIFVRSSKAELMDTLPGYNDSENNPYKFVKKGEIYKAFHKVTGEECGLFKEFKTLNRMSGGEFHGYGAIIYDECCPWTNRNELNNGHYFGFAAVASSITRNKEKGIKIYCIGNVVDTNIGMLEFYGIRRNDKFRYISRGTEENGCTILFINVDNIYVGGIASQRGAVQGMSPEFRHRLMNNCGELSSSLILNTDLWDYFEPYQSFIIRQKQTNSLIKVVVEIRRLPFNEYEPNLPLFYCVNCQIWSPATIIEGVIYTDCPILASGSKNTIFLPDLTLKKFILYDAAKLNLLRFYDKKSEDISQMIIQNLDPYDKFKAGF